MANESNNQTINRKDGKQKSLPNGAAQRQSAVADSKPVVGNHKSKKSKKRRRQRRRLMLLGAIAAFVLLLAVIFAIVAAVNGCGCKAQTASVETEPIETQTPEPTDTPLPTDEPYITPEPLIKDAWYQKRNEELERYVRAFGGLDSERDVKMRVAQMAIDPKQKRVAFTFDDGPRDELTDAILDVCEQYNIRVTFFIKGAYIQGHEKQLQRMLALGCEIGNHTWDHTDVETLSAEEMRYQITRVSDTLESLLGYHTHLFRPPYISYGKKGSETRENLLAIMREFDMAVINHTRSTHDTYDDYTSDMIYQRMIDPYDDTGHDLHNSIILCHDKTQRTIEAFRKAAPVLVEQGYQLVTVSELLYCSPDGFHAAGIYSKAD